MLAGTFWRERLVPAMRDEDQTCRIDCCFSGKMIWRLRWRVEEKVTDPYLDYLSREHARLEVEIAKELKQPQPDQVQIARLKKLKLAVNDQIQAIERDEEPLVA